MVDSLWNLNTLKDKDNTRGREVCGESEYFKVRFRDDATYENKDYG